MRPVFIVHYQGSKPFAADRWSKPYKTQAVAAAMAMQHLLRHRRGTDWSADVYRIGCEDFRGNNPGPQLTWVQKVEVVE